MTAQKTVLTENDGYELVAYQSGEKRIEHVASKTASDWLHWREVEAVKADPAQMAQWSLDYDLDDDA